MTDLGTPSGLWGEIPWYDTAPKDAGRHCGECGRFLKIYPRRLSRSMARSLIRLYLLQAKYPLKRAFHVKLFDKEGARGEFGVLSCWRLVIEAPCDDGSKRTSGSWGITSFGREFVEMRHHVPQYAVMKWGSELLGFAGRMVNVKECLEHGNRFKYDELMASIPEA